MTTWTIDRGRFVLGDRLHAGSSDEVRVGWHVRDPESRVLVTLTPAHPPDVISLVLRDAPSVARCAEILYAGDTDPGVPYENALVENLPPGEPAHTRVPLSEKAVARLGSELANVLAAVHARGHSLPGIRPELIYITSDEEPSFSGICASGPEFIASAPQPMHGPRSYRVPYFAPEAGLAFRPVPASDVFALCTTLFFLGTARHPFGDLDSIRTMLLRIAHGAVDRWPGHPFLGGVLARGMAHNATARPSAAEIAREFAAFS